MHYVSLCVCSYRRRRLPSETLEHAGVFVRRSERRAEEAVVQLDITNDERRRMACDRSTAHDGLLQRTFVHLSTAVSLAGDTVLFCFSLLRIKLFQWNMPLIQLNV